MMMNVTNQKSLRHNAEEGVAVAPKRTPSAPLRKTTTGEGGGVSGVRLQKQRVTGHSEYSRGAAAVLVS